MNCVTVVDRISREEFYREFVRPKNPLLIRNQTEGWKARALWSADYFQNLKRDPSVSIKVGNVSEGQRETVLLSEYVALLKEHEQLLEIGQKAPSPPYLHDVPIFHILPELIRDIEPFPLELFPKWYWDNWQNYIQFFMGPSQSLTPLHFDTLGTHNMFFQMVGSKKFILIRPEQRALCYMKSWRWASIDAQSPDITKYPNAQFLNTTEVVVNPGDILYMPPGMLHQVHGLSYSVSFNIDWHTTKSATKGVMSALNGAPTKNTYYNSLVLMGLLLNVPARYIFPRYKSYLNYVS